MIKCPNKGLPEWKALVDNFGEDMAYIAYDRNGENIPSLSKAKSILQNLTSTHYDINTTQPGNPPKGTENLAKEAVEEAEKQEPYIAVRTTLNRQMDQLLRRLSKIRDQQRSTTDTDKKRQLSLKYAELSERLRGVEKSLEAYRKVDNLDELHSLLDGMLANADDLLNLEVVTHDDIEEADRLITLLQLVGDFSSTLGKEHIIFSNEELNSDALKYGYTDAAGVFHNGYSCYKNQADDLSHKLDRLKEDFIVETVRKQTNNYELTKQQIFAALKDINYAKSMTMDGSSVNDPMVQAMYNTLSLSTIAASREVRERLAGLDSMLKEIKKFGNFKEIFGQTWSDGTYTGDLVDRFAQDFWDARSVAREEAFKANNIGAFEDWRKAHEVMFDVNLLFNEDGTEKESSPEIEAHKADLVKQLGQKGFEYYYQQQQEKIQLFNENREAYKDLLRGRDWSAGAKEDALRIWELETSPFINASKVINNIRFAAGEVKVGSRAGFYNVTVPRRYLLGTNKETGYYDPKFEKIENTPELTDFYHYMTGLLRDLKYMIPAEKRIDFHSNTLPDINRHLIATVGRGITGHAKGILDAIQSNFTNDDISSLDVEERDLRTGGRRRRARLKGLSNRESRVKEEIRLKAIELGRELNAEERIELRKQVLGELASKKTYDPEAMIKVLTSQILAYKYHSNTESTLNLLYEGLKNRNELNTNLAGKVLVDTDSRPIETKEGLKQLLAMLEYQWDTAYGNARHEVEGKIRKVLSNADKVKLAEYNKLRDKLEDDYAKGEIEEEKYLEDVEFLDKKIEGLGSYWTASATGDMALKWYTYLGMSYNVIAGTVNLFTGAFENSLKGMDGRLFSNADLWKSYGQVLQCSLGNAIQTETAKKIRAMNTKFDITQMAVNELYDLTSSAGLAKIRKKIAMANPLWVNERTEFQNQMPLIMAYMKHKKVYQGGEGISYWDAFDTEGNLKEGVVLHEKMTNTEALDRLKLEMDRLIKLTHGNYSSLSPMRAKKNIVGRILLQFRSWMPEMINTRIGAELNDSILGITMKGRYRSFGAVFSQSTIAGQTYSGLQNALFTVKQIARKLTFQKTKFDERMSEVDAANMRANLQEIFVLMGITASLLALKGLVPEEEPESNIKFLTNLAINLCQRYQSDILIYANPAEFEKISKNSVPVFGLISNIGLWTNSVWRLLTDADDEYAWDRFVKNTMRQFPIINQIPRMASYGSQIF